VNQYESAALAGSFQIRGYKVVDFEDMADLYVINTCTVTHLGDRKSRQLIRRAIRKNPRALIVVTGCYAQTASGEIMEIPGVDLVVGTRDRLKIVDLVETAVKGAAPVAVVSDYQAGDEFADSASLPVSERVRAFLKIQEGCDNCCTYCIVPEARGPQRSRRPEQVLQAAEQLVAAGYQEIVLTGTHTGSYGQDLSEQPTLANLLTGLEQLPGLHRLRISSIEPNDITPELVAVLSDSEKICRHLHIPLQSGSDKILGKMGRRYNAWEYARLVDVLKENIPHLGLSTDVIVGFPGETELDYQYTCKLVEQLSYSRLHVFKFSPRRGTPAANYPEQVDPSTVDRRSRKLIRLGEKLAGRFASTLVGLEMSVLVERALTGSDRLCEGLTDNYLRTVFPGNEDLVGQIVKVKIEGWDKDHLTAKLIRC
jgi:threonylcarbamoyladenosine tRNA methylthiotransferase MtaB